MKNFLKALGKAFLYFFAFLGIQSVVSFIFGVALSVKLMLQSDLESITQEQLTQLLQTEVTKYTTLIVLIANTIILLIIWLIFKLRKKNILCEVELNKCKFKPTLVAVIFGISFSLWVPTAIQMIPFSERLVDSFTQSHLKLSGGNPLINFIAVAVITPLVEECFFRGLIYTRLKRGMPIIAAATISSLLFAVLHGEIIWIIVTFFMGLMLIWVFEKTGSLLPCIIIHIINNAISQLTANITELPNAVNWIILIVCLLVSVLTAYLLNKEQKSLMTNNP